MKKIILTLLVATLTPVSALAWKALVVNPFREGVIYQSPELDSAEEAARYALEECRKMSMGFNGTKNNCKPLGRPFSAEVAVVMFGDPGFSVGYGPSPKKALAAGQIECAKISKRCHTYAAFESWQTRHAAIAYSATLGYFAHANAASQDEANEKVLALCARVSGGQCALKNFDRMSWIGTYAVAVGNGGTHQQIERATSQEMAQSDALRECEKATKQACSLSTNFAPVFNGATRLLSKEQINELRAIDNAGSKYRTALQDRLRGEPTSSGTAGQEAPRASAPKPDKGPCMETRVYKGHEADVIRSPGCY